MVGQLVEANSLQTGGRVVSVWAGGAALLLGTTLVLLKVIRLSIRDAWGDQRNRLLFFAGAWTFVTPLLLLFFVAKLRGLSFPEAKFPFYPTLIGFFAGCVLLARCVSPGRRLGSATQSIGLALAVGLSCVIAITGFARARAKMLPGDAYEISASRALGEKMKRVDGRLPVIAFLWHEGISMDTLKFYAAQAGQPTPSKLLYMFGGQWQDFAVVAPGGVAPADMMNAAEEAIIAKADFIVVNENPAAYRVAHSRNPLFCAGEDMVQRLLANDAFSRDHELTFRGDRFTLLRRR